MDKLKKKKTRKTAARKRLCKCTDVNVYVVYNLSHVKTDRTYKEGATSCWNKRNEEGMQRVWTFSHWQGKSLRKHVEGPNSSVRLQLEELGMKMGAVRHEYLAKQQMYQSQRDLPGR